MLQCCSCPSRWHPIPRNRIPIFLQVSTALRWMFPKHLHRLLTFSSVMYSRRRNQWKQHFLCLLGQWRIFLFFSLLSSLGRWEDVLCVFSWTKSYNQNSCETHILITFLTHLTLNLFPNKSIKMWLVQTYIFNLRGLIKKLHSQFRNYWLLTSNFGGSKVFGLVTEKHFHCWCGLSPLFQGKWSR